MAKIGLKLPKYCVLLDEDETLDVGKTMAKAIKADIKVNVADVKMYGDDDIDENIKEFKDGSITQEINDLDDTVCSDLLGQEITEGEITANGDDIAPFVRVGFITRRINKNVITYRAIIYLKVKYGIPDESYETKGENTVFKSTTIVGSIYRNKDNNWQKKKTFPTEAEAIEYLDRMLNIGCGLTVTSSAGTESGKTVISVLPDKASANTYKYKVGVTVAAPSIGSTVDSTFTAWDGTVEITAVTGQEICIVEMDAADKVVKTGKATVTSKE